MENIESIKYKQKPGMVTQSLSEDELMVVPTEGGAVDRVLSLNGSGGFVWNLLEQERSFDELLTLTVAEYGISVEEARNDLTEFLKSIKNYIE